VKKQGSFALIDGLNTSWRPIADSAS